MNPDNAMAKRTEVLYNLHKYGLLTRDTFDSLKTTDFGLTYLVDNHNEGLATYFRFVIRNFLLSWTKEHGYDLFEDGLKIYTTIDSRMQEYAEQAMKEHMDTLQSIFDDHWATLKSNPWIDDNGNEIEGFIENAMKRTPQYRALVSNYGKRIRLCRDTPE